jgi:fructose-bisphosphate aldolase class I
MKNNPALDAAVASILSPGKGILAADESFPTIEKRFRTWQIDSTEESRRDYREMLFATPGLGEFISGVILFDETIRQKNKAGRLLTDLLTEQNIIPGIKVDMGTVPLPNFPGEKVTQGFHGLRERLQEYHNLGARFTKWRAVLAIGDQMPSSACIRANSTMLALFAALSQEAGLVPIVEPEVLMNGNHGIARHEEASFEVLRTVFDTLAEHRVRFEQMLLKVGMVLSGDKAMEQAAVPEVADRTLECFRRCVPVAVPGIVFLSGGQTDLAATERLNAICARSAPWKLSFSFGRALQAPALEKWRGSPAHVALAQQALYHRAKCNSLALQGKYSSSMESR